MKIWFMLHTDPGRTVMVGTKGTLDDMFRALGNELFIILWYVGLIFCGKQSIEKTVESATAYETDIADFDRVIRFGWTRLPQSVSVCRISN